MLYYIPLNLRTFYSHSLAIEIPSNDCTRHFESSLFTPKPAVCCNNKSNSNINSKQNHHCVRCVGFDGRVCCVYCVHTTIIMQCVICSVWWRHIIHIYIYRCMHPSYSNFRFRQMQISIILAVKCKIFDIYVHDDVVAIKMAII